MQEERRCVHLDGAAQETVEDPHVPEETPAERQDDDDDGDLLLKAST